MTTAAPLALDRSAIPWLFATALATTLPHLEHQPLWMSAIFGLILLWGAWAWWRGQRLPSRWILAVVLVAGCAGVLLEYRTLLGRDAGVAMLFLFMAMKLLELQSRRDAYVVVNLGYFLLLTHYFHSQGIPTGLWLLAAMMTVTATLIRLHGGPASLPWPTLRYAGLMILQAVPLLVVLYLLFPRISGPLWGLPQDGHSARTGLSDRMAPGTVANLALSADIAFRVRFEGPPPHKDKLYWRGPVMDEYDGTTWSRRPESGPGPAIEALSKPVNYEVTLEAHDQRWLLALDAPIILPSEASLSSSLSVLSRERVSLRRRYALSSALNYRFNRQESSDALKQSTQLPPDRNPRSRALAEQWRRADPVPEHLVQKALALFRQEKFSYTLRPPPLEGDPVDGFLFETRKGFCEHYASAFTVLMRAAGVPARVVGGYQGGELNPVDGYLVVRQSDAHAWAEVWLEGRGWIRVDPTAAVSPNRVEAGLASSIPDQESLPALIRVDSEWLRVFRYRWEAANNAWNQWIIGYNSQRQREFLARLGLPDPDWRTLGTLLLAACGSVALLVTIWTLYRRQRFDPAQKLWRRALGRLKRRQIIPEPGETPFALVARLRIERPELAAPLQAVAEAYCRARYGAGQVDLAALRTAVAQLP